MKKQAVLFLLFVFVSISFGSLNIVKINDFLYPASNLKKIDSAVEAVKCTKVIDTNTIEVEFIKLGKVEKVTFIGVAEFSDEIDESSIIQMNEKNLLDRKLYLSYDWKARNDNDEILAYIWLPTFTEVGGYNILWNEILLLNGYAEYDLMALELQKTILFNESYEYARDKKLGVWKHIETERPFDFNNLPESVQSYVIEKYEQNFERETITTSATNVSAAPDSSTVSEFLKELMVGVERGMTPGELEQSITASKYSGRYEGSLLEQSWVFDFDYKYIKGIGENLGMTVQRLNSIDYYLRGDYDDDQRFAIFEKIRDVFLAKFGEPSEINKAENTYLWELSGQKIEIILLPKNRNYYSNSWRNGMFFLTYVGDLKF